MHIIEKTFQIFLKNLEIWLNFSNFSNNLKIKKKIPSFYGQHSVTAAGGPLVPGVFRLVVIIMIILSKANKLKSTAVEVWQSGRKIETQFE